MQDVVRQVVRADLHGLHHVRRNLLSGVDGLGHADDFFFLADASVKKRRDAETDYQRRKNADNADNRPVFENTHKIEPPKS
ncbi:hypothetical protein SDC9_166196 [bioreactor metagenome]|uniref:Uncharacterized protein n=1 Tax=bioreactor metagenome TaxID=1076179 RepID=A0A645FWB5_9ZZZZ